MWSQVTFDEQEAYNSLAALITKTLNYKKFLEVNFYLFLM